MKFKKLSWLLASLVLAVSVLFTAGCSDDELNSASELVEFAANVLSETQEEEQDAATVERETEVQTAAAAEQETEVQTAAATEQEPAGEAPTTLEPETEEQPTQSVDQQISEDGEYLSMEQVSVYLHLYGHLPGNYLTKSEAKKAGWVPSKGNLWDVAPGCAIGGDKFGNREKLLPSQKGRKYYECDVNYAGGDRGAERIVYSNDGLIYYTDNHYEDFMLLFEGSDD